MIFWLYFFLLTKGHAQQHVAMPVEAIENMLSSVKGVLESERNTTQKFLQNESLRLNLLNGFLNHSRIIDHLNNGGGRNDVSGKLKSDQIGSVREEVGNSLDVYRMQKKLLKYRTLTQQNNVPIQQANVSKSLENMLRDRHTFLPNGKDLQSVIKGRLILKTLTHIIIPPLRKSGGILLRTCRSVQR